MRSCDSTTEKGHFSNNQGVQELPVITFFMTVEQIHTTVKVGSNRETNLPATTYFIEKSPKRIGVTSDLPLPNTRKGTGSYLISHIIKLRP